MKNCWIFFCLIEQTLIKNTNSYPLMHFMHMEKKVKPYQHRQSGVLAWAASPRIRRQSICYHESDRQSISTSMQHPPILGIRRICWPNLCSMDIHCCKHRTINNSSIIILYYIFNKNYPKHCQNCTFLISIMSIFIFISKFHICLTLKINHDWRFAPSMNTPSAMHSMLWLIHILLLNTNWESINNLSEYSQNFFLYLFMCFI
jgi:hypothetical protein